MSELERLNKLHEECNKYEVYFINIYLHTSQYKSLEFVREYAKARKTEIRYTLERLFNPLYSGYVNVPKDSDNRFDVCESILPKKI